MQYNKEILINYMHENPDYIIPLIYDSIIRNMLKNNPKLLCLIINNVMKTSFSEDDIYIRDGKNKKIILLKEKENVMY